LFVSLDEAFQALYYRHRKFQGVSVPPSVCVGKVKVNVKVELSLCLTKHHAMKTCRGMEV
jgi:hypothetical protein